MTRIVLEIPQESDLTLLIALMERLNIKVVQDAKDSDSSTIYDDRSFILQGLPAREDFEDFIRDFESSRQDRPLPGREN